MPGARCTSRCSGSDIVLYRCRQSCESQKRRGTCKYWIEVWLWILTFALRNSRQHLANVKSATLASRAKAKKIVFDNAGSNIARQFDKLSNPMDRIKRWLTMPIGS